MGLMKELNDLNAIYLKMHEQQVSENQDKGYVVTKADKKGNTKAWQGYKAGVKSKTTGKPLYRAADHLKNEEVEVEVDEGYGRIKTPEKLVAKVRQPKKVAAPKGSKMKEEVEVDESIGSAIDKGLSAGADVAKVAGGAAVGGVKVASKVIKKTAGAAGRVAGTVVGAAKSAKKGYKGGASTDEEFEVTPEFLKLIESGLFSDEELVKMIEGYQRDPEQSKKDRHHSKQPDPSKDGFTGIGNMSIDDIMKMNAKIKAKAAKKK